MSPIKSILYLCPSVKPVVDNSLTTDGTDGHGFGEMKFGLGEMHQLFGGSMDGIIEELNEGLVA